MNRMDCQGRVQQDDYSVFVTTSAKNATVAAVANVFQQDMPVLRQRSVASLVCQLLRVNRRHGDGREEDGALPAGTTGASVLLKGTTLWLSPQAVSGDTIAEAGNTNRAKESGSKKVWLTFAEAREFVQRLKLKNRRQWEEWCRSGQRSSNIPSHPDQIYTSKGWVSIADWLGPSCTNVSSHNRKFLPLAEARAFVQRLKLQNSMQWWEWSNSGQRPNNIPGHPNQIYKNKGWDNWADWLGPSCTNVPKHNRKFLPFAEARAFVQRLKLKNSTASMEPSIPMCKRYIRECRYRIGQ